METCGFGAVKPVSVHLQLEPLLQKGTFLFLLLMGWLKWLFSACCKRSRLLWHLLLTLMTSGMQFLLTDVSVTQSYKITYCQTLSPEQCMFPPWDALMWIWWSQIPTKSYSLLKTSIYPVWVTHVCWLSWNTWVCKLCTWIWGVCRVPTMAV